MGESTPPSPAGGDTKTTLRATLQALLSNVRLVTAARCVALAVPTGSAGQMRLAQVVGPGLTPGSALDPETVPGMRVLPLPPPGEGVPAPSAVLLVQRGLISNEPGSALASCLLALAAVVHSAQAVERDRRAAGPAAPAPAPAADLPAAGIARPRPGLERLFQQLPAGIVALSPPDFRVREVNRAYLQFLDEPFRSGSRDLHGLPLAAFLPQAAESGVLALVERAAASGAPVQVAEFAYPGFSRGVTYWDWSLVPLQETPGGPVTEVVWLAVERTSQVLAQQRLAAALDRARQQAAELDAVIQQMAADATRARALEAQSVTLNAARVPLQDAIPQAVAEVQGLAAARGVTVLHQVPDHLPAVWGDEERLHQVLINLLSNAIQFTPAGGTVIVRASVSALPAAASATQPDSAFVPQDGESVVVTVQDTGVGLPAEQLERVWDRFDPADSTTRRYGGPSRGLAIVRHLVDLHGGQVWATSAGAGRGSTFHFRLPLAPPPAVGGPAPDARDPASGADRPPRGAAGARPLVLVIEDNRDLAAIIGTMLDAEGYRVELARAGPRSLAHAIQLQPAAILLDVVLSQAHGWEVLQQLGHTPATRAIPIIMVAILEYQRLGMLLGATEYLVPPFDRDRLVR
ncbi:MAG TPA: ATP-binding protein, partial [Chloroflexia bacterium]|nr:ATP-binding protein [Chloroflexia bacterium]